MAHERYHSNTLGDYNGEQLLQDNCLLMPDDLRLFVDMADQVLADIENYAQQTSSDDFSLYTGECGYALAELYAYTRGAELGLSPTKRAQLLQRALSHVRNALGRLGGRRVSFLCGDAGPLALGCFTFALTADANTCLSLAQRLAQLWNVAKQPSTPDEVLYGRSGYLCAVLFVRQLMSRPEVDASLRQQVELVLSEKLLSEVAASILESGKRLGWKDCPLMYEWHDKRYLGAAHGIAGILQQLFTVAHLLPPDAVSKLLLPTLYYCLRQKYPQSDNFCSSVDSTSDKLVQWCHGSPGWVCTLLAAHRHSGDERYLREARLAGEVSWQRGLLRKGCGLCHGVAGNGYAFLSLYRATGDNRYLYRAVQFARYCARRRLDCSKADRPMSLFEGCAGAVCFLIDVCRPAHSAFPAYEFV